MRISSPLLFRIAKKVLLSLGATVIDIGLSSTSTFYFACQKYGYDAGIQISASHNPPEYNGMKFVKWLAGKLVKIGANTGMKEVKKIALDGNFIETQKQGVLIKKNDILQNEITNAWKIIRPEQIKKLTIVADAANAMGSLFLKEIFRKLPCRLVKMNFKLDGTFPAHQPNPLQFETLKDLQKKVRQEKADLGIATDGDGDRVFFVDEKSRIIPSSLITSLVAREILKRYPGEKIMFDIRYVRNVEKTCLKYGGKPIISKVGHALISEHMAEENAIFAGESSGHYFFRDIGFAESSVLIILYVLEAINQEDKPISKILSQFATSVESGELNFMLNSTTAKNIFNYFAKEYSDGKISWLDGIAINYPRWRFGIRSSNTEPLIRLNVEANSEALVNNKIKEIKEKILRLGARVKD